MAGSIKLSVSVPEEVWLLCKGMMDEDSDSAVVQIALRYYLEQHPPDREVIDLLAHRIAEKLYRDLLGGSGDSGA